MRVLKAELGHYYLDLLGHKEDLPKVLSLLTTPLTAKEISLKNKKFRPIKTSVEGIEITGESDE